MGTNRLGSCESRCKLSISIPEGLKPPKFVQPLSDLKIEEGSPIRLLVKVKAQPKPELSWSKDGRELIHGHHYRMLFDDDKDSYSLVLLDTFREDGGAYSVTASNSVGSATSHCRVLVQETPESAKKKAEAGNGPKFRLPLINREIPAGFGLALVCSVTGAPPPVTSWLKDGKPCDPARYAIRNENGVCQLSLDAAAKADGGEYVCVAENREGSTRTACQLTVTDPEGLDIVAPKFLEPLMDVCVLEGHELILECKVSGKPLPQITWYKDGLELFLENRMLHYTDRKGVCRLNIMRVHGGDAGRYSCEAANKAGKDFTHCEVRLTEDPRASRLTSPVAVDEAGLRRASPSRVAVHRPPLITRPLADTTVSQGRRVALECEVEGFPPPAVEWWKDGQLVTESRHLRTYFDGHTATLKIYEAHVEEHEGVYLAKAVSPSGTVETRARLIVEPPSSLGGVDRAPKFVEKLTDQIFPGEGEAATLGCFVTGHPRPQVTWLWNGHALAPEELAGDRVPQSFDDGAHSLHFPAVSLPLCGVYTARATNEWGSVSSSATLGVTIGGQAVVGGIPAGFAKPPPSTLTVKEGERLDLISELSGDPYPILTLFKDGAEIQPTGGRSSLEFSGSLVMLVRDPVRLRDDGEYTFHAQNTYGKAEAATIVSVVRKYELIPVCLFPCLRNIASYSQSRPVHG